MDNDDEDDDECDEVTMIGESQAQPAAGLCIVYRVVLSNNDIVAVALSYSIALFVMKLSV